MNKIIMIGRWTKDVELRYLSDGTAVAKSTIAVDEGYGDKKKTHFFNVVMWEKTAEATAQYSGKGKKVAIVGRLQQRSWEKDGAKQYAIEIVAEQVEFLESKEQGHKSSIPQESEQEGTSPPLDIMNDGLPF